MIRARAAAFLVVGFALLSARAVAAEVDLGILEHLSPAQQTRLEKTYGQKPQAVVRVAFHGAGGTWVAFPSDIAAIGQFPAKVAWNVAFDGQARGRLDSASPPQWLAYADLGLQFLLPGAVPPRIGAPAAAYEQWDSDTPVRRPLVVVSGPHVEDPEHWKPAPPDAALLQRGKDSFRARLAEENQSLAADKASLQLMKSYRSAKGEFLLAFLVQGKAPPPDEVPGPEWSPHWFVAGASGAMRFLGNELLLIDAGDYDGDGRSELVFRKSSYDYDGYVIYFDDFAKSAEFGWNYH